ncbi:hypothetical protein DEJ13_15840 [Curtobacterium sp. MCLR17_007]|uniref:hypothetical protein n=1 Tax=Curtobacterium sp. MCLR17_007 TaxID=2175648 RepID=UPI0024DFC2CD|nr:hypothetical protein [Curtobacterium sp. MCLR17_007]WIB59891.1 hypothetical protein DEJ13_15840 [Curtobacterium sp. MCLR17_007]
MSRSVHRYRPTAIAAAVLATLAAGAGALPASAATASTAAPSFIAVSYDGDFLQPDAYDTVTIGSDHRAVFELFTEGVTGGSVTVRDADGSELCTAPVLPGSIGIAHCDTVRPLKPGVHDVTAVTTAATGASSPSEVLHLGVHGDDHSGDTPDPIVAQPAPGDTDTGFTASGVAAPVVTLGQTMGDHQSLLFDAPELGNDGGRGHIKLYDASGSLVQDREWYGPLGSDGVQLWVAAPFGEKTVYHAEYVLPAGTSARTEVVVDRTGKDLPAPTFAFEPGVQGDRILFNLYGVPGATATFTDSDGTEHREDIGATGMAAFTGTVARNAQNTYSITQTKAGQTSAPLTHEVDTRTGTEDIVAQPAPGDTDPGFTAPGDSSDEIATPVVASGRVLPDRKTAELTIPDAPSTVLPNGRYLFTDESGVTTERRISPNWRYLVPVSHSGAQTFTIVKKVGDAVSAPTTFRVRGLD